MEIIDEEHIELADIECQGQLRVPRVALAHCCPDPLEIRRDAGENGRRFFKAERLKSRCFFFQKPRSSAYSGSSSIAQVIDRFFEIRSE